MPSRTLLGWWGNQGRTSNFSPAPVGHWALDLLVKLYLVPFPLPHSHRDPKQRPKNLTIGSPLRELENPPESTPSYLQWVRHREAHQASTETVPGDHCKQGGKQDNAVAYTLQPHSQPPTWRHRQRDGWTHGHTHTPGVSFSGTWFIAGGRRGGGGHFANWNNSPIVPERGLVCPAHGTWGRRAEGTRFQEFLTNLASPGTKREFSRSDLSRKLKLAFLRTNFLSLKPLKYTHVCVF